MRNLFLLTSLIMLLAACSSTAPPPSIPTIQPEEPWVSYHTPTRSTAVFTPFEQVERDLKEQDFVLREGVWRKESKFGKASVTVTSKDQLNVEVIARFERPDGVAICQIQAVKLAFVSGVEALDEVPTAKELINRRGWCQAA